MTLLLSIPIIVIRRRKTSGAKAEPNSPVVTSIPAEPTVLSKKLRDSLPSNIIFPHDAAFKDSMNAYWAQQECEGMALPSDSSVRVLGAMSILTI